MWPDEFWWCCRKVLFWVILMPKGPALFFLKNWSSNLSFQMFKANTSFWVPNKLSIFLAYSEIEYIDRILANFGTVFMLFRGEIIEINAKKGNWFLHSVLIWRVLEKKKSKKCSRKGSKVTAFFKPFLHSYSHFGTLMWYLKQIILFSRTSFFGHID